MKAEINEESYGLVLKLASKFAYSNTSLEYEQYVNDGLKGLEKAIKYYSEDKDTKFSSFATTCIVSALKTSKKKQDKFDLQQDENIIIENLDSFVTSMVEEDMAKTAKKIIIDANNGNERNAEMFLLNIGFNGEEPMSYKELSAKFNVSDERVRQVCVKTRKTIVENRNVKELLYSYVG